MTRIALVTGGTRGIGNAISIALKDMGVTVAANYGGNDEAAKALNEETGIPAFKFDVSDFEACKAGIAQVEADVGPIDILVNNAGITRDKPLHKMEPDQWHAVIDANLSSDYNLTRNIIEGMRERGFGRIINISSINGQKGQFGQVNYSATKGRIDRLHQGRRTGNSLEGHNVQRHRARLHRHGNGQGSARRGFEQQNPALDSDRTIRGTGRNRPLRRLSGLRRRRFHHRLDPHR
jgi:NAD(P)-dependent dehydrogenase (short-subunit alcohol dehydrogenase family)